MLDQLENNYHNYEKTENSKKKYSRVRSALNLFTVFSHENVNFFLPLACFQLLLFALAIYIIQIAIIFNALKLGH